MRGTHKEREEIFALLRDRTVIEKIGLEVIRARYPGMDIQQLSDQLMARRFQDWMVRSLDLLDHVESPIEQVFMTAMIVQSMRCDAFAVEFRPATEDADEDIRKVRDLMELRDNVSRAHDAAIQDIMEDAGNTPEKFRKEFLKECGDYEDFETFITTQVTTGKLSLQDRQEAFDRFPFFVYDHHVFCFIQPIIHCGETRYRPDFLMWMPKIPTIKIAVECDGREQHSTDESFVNDRIRDRNLVLNGYHVLRYSGSEIFKDPSAVSRDLHIQILGRLANAS